MVQLKNNLITEEEVSSWVKNLGFISDRKRKILEIEKKELLSDISDKNINLIEIEKEIEEINFEKIDFFLEQASKIGITPKVVGTYNLSNLNKAFFVFFNKGKEELSKNEIKSFWGWSTTSFAQIRKMLSCFNLCIFESGKVLLTEKGKGFLEKANFSRYSKNKDAPELTVNQKAILLGILKETDSRNINEIRMQILCTLRFCCDYFSEGGFKPIMRDSKLSYSNLLVLNKFFYTNYSEHNEMTVSANNIIIFGTNYCKELGLIVSIKNNSTKAELHVPTRIGLSLLKELSRKIKWIS